MIFLATFDKIVFNGSDFTRTSESRLIEAEDAGSAHVKLLERIETSPDIKLVKVNITEPIR